ncbi:MAG: hypothetical protein IKO25_01050 [Clostridia bacterium]|nr:hypothetical protein [Clostridia bacterium]
MKTDFFKNRTKYSVLLSLLLAVMLLPFGSLGEAAATEDYDGGDLFDDDDYYGWLFSGDEYKATEEDLALANLLILREYNSSISDWCRQEAEKLSGNPDVQKEYEDLAVVLQSPAPGRPTEEESRMLTEQYLSNISSQLQQEAVDYYRRCVAAEPVITADLYDVSEAIGTEMFGIGFRLKSAGENAKGVCRIADKIAEQMEMAELAGAPITYLEAAESIQDIIRYTQLGTPDTLVWNYMLTKQKLEEKGYRFILTKNTWRTYTVKKPYRGVNVKVESPSGIIFELQFHTAESLVTKMVEHINYEVIRDPKSSPEEKAKLLKRSFELFDRLTEPDFIELIR